MDASPNMADSLDNREPLWLADGLEHAFLGLMYQFQMPDPIACYDYDLVIQGFMANGMTKEEALEHFDYNVIGAYVGERTPCYLKRMSLEEAIDTEEQSLN